MDVPIWIITGFQQWDRQDSQNLNNHTFCRLLVTSAHGVIGTENYPDTGVMVNCDDDDCFQVYRQIKEDFTAWTKDYNLQPYITDHGFRSSNIMADDVGNNLYVLDIQYQQNFTASQPIKVGFKFDGVVTIDINGYALVLTN